MVNCLWNSSYPPDLIMLFTSMKKEHFVHGKSVLYEAHREQEREVRESEGDIKSTSE